MANGNKKIFRFLILALSIGLGYFCFLNKSNIEFPIKKELELDSPFLVRDFKNLRFILDKQRTQIIAVDKESDVVKKLLPKNLNEADAFYYADDFLVDQKGWVYVKEGAWDGNRISREAVLIYDENGNYKKTYFDTRHSSIVNKHKMSLLYAGDDKIVCGVKNENSIDIRVLDLKENRESKMEYQFSEAFDFVNDMTMDKDGNVFVLDKAGRLFKLGDDGKVRILYKAENDEYPNWIEPSSPGKLLYSDLYSSSVMELDLQSGKKRLVLEDSGAVTVTPIAFSRLTNPKKNPQMLKKEVLLFAIFVLFLLCALYIVAATIVSFFKSKMKVIQRISVYVAIIVIAVAATITFRLTAEFSKVMRTQILAQMENMAYSVANSIRPKTLDSIDCAADFASGEYRQMISNMESVIDSRLEINKNVYCDIFKYDEKRGVYACAFLDQAIGTYFPVTPGEAEEIKMIYQNARSVSSSKDDTSASYTYVSVPVVSDEGRVCGVVSVMTENFMLVDQINGMKRNVLLGIVVTLIFVWLAMGEALSYILSKSQAQMEMEQKKALGEKTQKAFPHYYIRLMVFALFAAYNMTTTFLPMVIAKGALESLGKNAGNFAAALPISVNLLIIGLMALFCEGMIRRAGCKKIVVLGTLLSAASNLIIFVFPTSYLLLFIALFIDGIGVGLTTNSMYLMVSKIPDAKNRTSGYAAYNAAQVSGINFGMLFGAALASNIGRHLIFPLVSVMWLLSALLFFAFWKSLNLDQGQDKDGQKENFQKGRQKELFDFLRHRRVWTFILCIQAPFALMGSFVYYYLPLYSDLNGLSEVMVAVLMMLYSIFAIYLGNGLTKWVTQKTGPLSPYVSILLSAAAVLLYAASGNFFGLLAAIFILGLANGFGRSVQQVQFSMLSECEKFGVPQAMGIFNFTDFIGQSFGPAVIGLVFLSKNLFASTALFAIVLSFLCLTHFMINLTKKKR